MLYIYIVTHIGSSLRKTYTYIIGTPYIYIHVSWIPQHPEFEAIFLELEAILPELEAIFPELEAIFPVLETLVYNAVKGSDVTKKYL
mgnify:CR=1 FL=1